MKSLLIVLVALVASPAWGQPAPAAGSGSAASAGSGSSAPSALEPGAGPSVPVDVTQGVPAGAGSGSAAAGVGSGSAAPTEYPLEAGAIETAKGTRCYDLKHKPWYEQLTCRPHDTGGTYWMPTGANKEGDGVDTMFYATLALSAFFFFAITGVVVYFVIKYRGKKGHRALPSPSHNDTLEITWTVIPTIIVVFLFYYGWRGYINMVTPPVKAVEIQVIAQKWQWNFIHPNGVSDSNLHVPSGTPVRLVMTSTDVLHSFFIPAMRTKQDVVPRRFTYVWFEATKPGTYRLYCAEYCGTNHSQMKVQVVVHKPHDYERYLAEKAEADQSKPLPELGADLYDKMGCIKCHTIDGTPRIGPSFKDDFGSMVTLSTGETIKMDETYIRHSILAPQSQARPGYPASMPVFEGQLKERQILALIEFVKAQSKNNTPAKPPAEAPPAK